MVRLSPDSTGGKNNAEKRKGWRICRVFWWVWKRKALAGKELSVAEFGTSDKRIRLGDISG
jgi:hypothetical protein